MSLPAWCRAEQHMEEEEVQGTHSAGEAGGVCRAAWGVCWSCFVPVCSTRRVCTFTHVCAGVSCAGSLGKRLWVHVEGFCCMSQEGLCVCLRVCG